MNPAIAKRRMLKKVRTLLLTISQAVLPTTTFVLLTKPSSLRCSTCFLESPDLKSGLYLSASDNGLPFMRIHIYDRKKLG